MSVLTGITFAVALVLFGSYCSVHPPPPDDRVVKDAALLRDWWPLILVAVGLAGLGALLAPGRRREFIAAGVGTFGAHAAAVLIKRVVKRTRPDHPAIAVNVGTPSRLSFPSAHATSTTAAAMLLGRAVGLPRTLPALLVPPMALSRLVLGVHYPTDVATGVVVGALAPVPDRREAGLPAADHLVRAPSRSSWTSGWANLARTIPYTALGARRNCTAFPILPRTRGHLEAERAQA